MKLLNKFKNSDQIKFRASMLISANVLSNLFNLLYNAYLGRNITIEEFALVSFIGSVLSLSDIPISALNRTITSRSAFLLGKNKKPATSFWRFIRNKSILVAVVASAIWLLLSPLTSSFFKIDSLLPIISFTPIWILSVITAIDGGYLGGSLRFGYLAFVAILESIVKLSVAIILTQLGFGEYAYLAILSSIFVASTFVFIAARKISKKQVVNATNNIFPSKFFITNALTRVSTVAYLSSDVILAKHFLSVEQSGQYALLSLTGKIVFFAGSLFTQFILPLVSHRLGNGKKYTSLFYKLLTASLISSFSAFLLVGVFGHLTIPFVFGSKAINIMPYIFWYSLSMVAFSVSANLVIFAQVRGKYLLTYIGILLSVAQIAGILISNNSLSSINGVMVFMGFASLGVLSFFHLTEPYFITIGRNITDIIGVLGNFRSQSETTGLRILIFNWRDTKHKWAGGAEVYVHELAKRWVKNNNSVTLFCGNDGENSRNEVIDGVNIIRRGGFYTVYLWASIYYILHFRKNYDVIVDSENGIPFFSPFFSTKPVILLIHHVHQEIFIEHLKFPLSYIARFIEAKLMPVVYRNKTIITVSESTKKEIVKVGIAKEADIHIVNPGIELPLRRYKKSSTPLVIYLGRLKAYKNIDIAIKSFSIICKKVKTAKLWIVGEGDSVGSLRDLVIKLGLENKVTFFGKVDEDEKVKLLSQSWVAVQPSQVEGWGITVLEANACKTPVVASDTKGLRDSIVNGKTGKLVKIKDVNAFAKEIQGYIKNNKKRSLASHASYIWAKKFNWDKSSMEFLDAISESVMTSREENPIRKARYAVSRFSSLF